MTKLQAHEAVRTGLCWEQTTGASQAVSKARRQRSVEQRMSDVGAP